MTTTIDQPTATQRRPEVPPTLADPVPQPLGVLDQLGLWGNLGVSLLGFTGAIFVLRPGGGLPDLSLFGAIVATVLGTVLGTGAFALAGVPGARTGAPAMVSLRGVFGSKPSYLPTVLNIAQCLGWGVFEIVTIAGAAHRVMSWAPGWILKVIAGVITTGLALRPLGSVRLLRRYVSAGVVLVLVYLFVMLLRHPLPPLTKGSWSGFWIATDTVVAVAVSFAPLVSDYTRHSRSGRAAFTGVFVGYSVTQILCYLLGIFALVTVARDNDIYGVFIAVPVGALAFGVLAIRELDESFANVYSTVVSIQNLRPRWDRRVIAVAIGTLTTAAALGLDISDYENFLLLIGSVFVPLTAVLIVDYFAVSRGRWDLDAAAAPRWSMLAPWAAGFVVYQMINPGYIGWWVHLWSVRIDGGLGFTPHDWMSASILSFLVAAVLTGAVGRLTRSRIAARPVRGFAPQA